MHNKVPQRINRDSTSMRKKKKNKQPVPEEIELHKRRNKRIVKNFFLEEEEESRIQALQMLCLGTYVDKDGQRLPFTRKKYVGRKPYLSYHSIQ
ncbi:hypothetical protein CEXT_8731 [Caerostris extrusa]|uniref:Uncharacterized protein n=1 Tax=Caerostris extrusa TaxID=172846 RepID=A0AAV4PFG7_CAEEX|nr:hypothetical protein CEXT_8731 [Caerostris extrusa]